jgi:hypothetical protein
MTICAFGNQRGAERVLAPAPVVIAEVIDRAGDNQGDAHSVPGTA